MSIIRKIRTFLHNPGVIVPKINYLYVRILDKKYGTNFAGHLSQGQIGLSAERANDTSEDSVIDLGCGKGLAMYYLGKMPFSSIGGWSFHVI